MPVLRSIEGFHLDAHGDWVAELRCGHGQHVRHKPPFWSRPWVLTEEGRIEKLGVELPCVLCERFEMPAGHQPYKRTVEFTASSIPDGLKREHSTKRGIWAVIHVLEGRLHYAVEAPLVHEELLVAGSRGVIVPEILHRVTPDGEVRFYVEFYRGPG